MHSITTAFLLCILAADLVNGAPVIIPRPRPQPSNPTPHSPTSPEAPQPQVPPHREPPSEIPSSPNRQPGGDPVPPPSEPNSGPELLTQDAIRQNMGGVEQKMKSRQEIAQNAFDVMQDMKDIVEAMLKTSTSDPADDPEETDCADVSVISSPTITGIDATSVPSSTTDVTIVTACGDAFTPTTTLPSTLFAACTSYASTLSSCASATPSFYSLGIAEQASCACYSMPPIIKGVCTGTRQAVAIATPSLNVQAFDENANSCQNYFAIQGYGNIAKALQGSLNDQTILGAGFCNKMNQAMRNGNGSVGMSTMLEPVTYTDCEGQRSTTTGAEPTLWIVNGAPRGLPLMGYNLAVLVGGALVILNGY